MSYSTKSEAFEPPTQRLGLAFGLERLWVERLRPKSQSEGIEAHLEPHPLSTPEMWSYVESNG